MDTQKSMYHGDLSSKEAGIIPAKPPGVLRATRGSLQPSALPPPSFSVLLLRPAPAALLCPPLTSSASAFHGSASKKQGFIDQEAKFKLWPSQNAQAAKAREHFQL